MTIELTVDEIDLLRGLLEERIGDLGPELHHTRSPDYHEQLKQLKSKLQTLHERFVPSR